MYSAQPDLPPPYIAIALREAGDAFAHACALAPVQEGFWEEHGLQCGYCTPGMLMAAQALLSMNRDPSEAEIRNALRFNLCRCGAHLEILAAVRLAGRRLRGAA